MERGRFRQFPSPETVSHFPTQCQFVENGRKEGREETPPLPPSCCVRCLPCLPSLSRPRPFNRGFWSSFIFGASNPMSTNRWHLTHATLRANMELSMKRRGLFLGRRVSEVDLIWGLVFFRSLRICTSRYSRWGYANWGRSSTDGFMVGRTCQNCHD